MYVQRTYNHGRFQGQKCSILSKINGFAMVIRQINGFNWHQKSSLVLFEKFHLFSCKFSFRNSIEKFAMVICTYSVHITMEDFRVRMADFKPNKWLQLALEVFSSIIRTISSLQLQVLLPKQYRKIRHGYMYIQRTYYHGRFQGQKCCILSQINGFAMVIRQINGFNWHWKYSLVLFEQFHHFSCKFSFRKSIEKFAMVICTYSVHITMEDFRVREVDFKPNKWLQLALEVFSSVI